MSSKRGDCQRKRPQAHQNSTSFKNDLHDNSTRTKALNAMNINEVCQRCHDVIEWKIKYRKYKALSKPACCNICNERKVKKAYHVICRDCALAAKQCAKCLKSDSEVSIIPPGPTSEERLKLKLEMEQLIKSLSERKRRTFLRFMKGKKLKKNEDDDHDEEAAVAREEPEMRTRTELLAKIEQLKGTVDDFYDGVADDDDDDSWDTEDYESDE